MPPNAADDGQDMGCPECYAYGMRLACKSASAWFLHVCLSFSHFHQEQGSEGNSEHSVSPAHMSSPLPTPSCKPPGVICAIVGASLQAVGLQFWKLYYLQKERMEAELEHGTVREIQVHREFHSVRDLDLAADRVVAMDASIASSRSPSRLRQQQTVLRAEDTGHAAGACMQATAQQIQTMSPVSEGDELAASSSLSPEASASFTSDHTCTGDSKHP